VFTKDRFELVSAKDLDPEDLGKTKRSEFDHLPLGRHSPWTSSSSATRTACSAA
jgi:hypothetical protein